MNCIKLLLRTVFIIRDLHWKRTFDILCISMILLLMTGISLLTMLLKKSIDLFLRPCLCYQLQSIEQNMYVLL